MAFMDGNKKKPGGGGELDGYLGPGTVIEGTVRFAEVLRVDGKISGKVFSERELIVGEDGRLLWAWPWSMSAGYPLWQRVTAWWRGWPGPSSATGCSSPSKARPAAETVVDVTS